MMKLHAHSRLFSRRLWVHLCDEIISAEPLRGEKSRLNRFYDFLQSFSRAKMKEEIFNWIKNIFFIIKFLHVLIQFSQNSNKFLLTFPTDQFEII